MRVGVIGTGYVGLVASVCFADAGNELTCVDSNPEKLNKLKDKKLPFYEPGLNDLFQRNFARMAFTGSIAEAVQKSDLVFIAVGTPEMPDGSADMTATFHVLKEICKSATKKKYVVLKSTVPIGTAKECEAFCRDHASAEIEIVNNVVSMYSSFFIFLHP